MKFAATVLTAALLAASAATATAQDMRWQKWDYRPWHESFCSLAITEVYHPNNDQPVHFKIRNTSQTRLRYTIAVAILKNGRNVHTGNLSVDNANKNEVSDAQTAPYVGTLQGTTIAARITSCSIPK